MQAAACQAVPERKLHIDKSTFFRPFKRRARIPKCGCNGDM
jgi:hypothetical protein